MELEHLVSNLSGRVRMEVVDGRTFIVAPLSMIVPGVLNGSKGPLFYPVDEISRSTDYWNGIPIVINHPTDDDGNAVSARSPDVLKKFGVGTVYNANYKDKLSAEGWFDVKKLQALSPSTLSKLEQGKPEELSTGLFTDNVPARNGETHKGRQYSYVARNYRPDHLAILPGKRGACSIDDGCGVNVNQGDQWYELLTNEEEEPDLDQYIDWDEDETAGKQWQDLIVHAGVVANFQKEKYMPLTKEQKDQIISDLIGNSGIDEGPWVEEDRIALESLPEAKLVALNKQRELLVNASETEEEPEGDEGDNCPVCPDKKPTKNEETSAPVVNQKPKTAQEWLAEAPVEIRSVVNNAMAVERKQKGDLIDKIVKNERNMFSKEYLEARTIEELRGIASLASNQEEEQSTVLMPHYAGVAGGHTRRREIVANEDQDMVPEPFDWKK